MKPAFLICTVLFSPKKWMRHQRCDAHAARQTRLSRESLLCHARIPACPEVLSERLAAALSVSLGGTLPLRRDTQRCIISCETGYKHRRSLSASTRSRKNRCVARVHVKGTQMKNPGGKAVRFPERHAFARRVQHIFWDARQVFGAKSKMHIKNVGNKI